MDPAATIQAWLDAIKDGDKSAVNEAMRAYRQWTAKNGFPAEVKTFSARVFGVPVKGVVLALGTKYATCKLYYTGVEWRESVPSTSITEILSSATQA